MKIGLDIKAALESKRSGIGSYVYHLLKNLLILDKMNEYYLYSSITNAREHLRLSYKNNPVFVNRTNPFSLLNKLDAFHGPDFKLLPVRAKKKIVTIHDFASFMNEDFMSPAFKQLTQMKINKSLKKADVIVTVSSFVKHQLMEHFNLTNRIIEVVHHGIRDDLSFDNDENKIISVLKKYGIEMPFILFVGNLEIRKNILALLKSYSLFKEKFKTNHQLVLIGKGGYGYERIKEELDKNPFRSSIKEIGWIIDDDLTAIYASADLFLFLSYYEGFGMPVLEAMKCRLPVICSDIPVLKEIAGESAVYVNINDAEEISNEIYKLVSDMNYKMQVINKGLEQITNFGWDKAALRMIEIYKS